MLPRLTAFIAAVAPVAVVSAPAAAQAPDVIPSRFVRVVEFTDEGNAYRVDVETGKVTKSRASDVVPIPPDPAPTPQPPPTPDPPSPVAGDPAWVCLFVNPAKADAQWLDSDGIRAAAAKAGVQFRGYRSPELEVDALGFRKLVRANEVPCVVVLDKDGKVILSRKVSGFDDVIRIIGGAY
jgi:hypothetical protein